MDTGGASIFNEELHGSISQRILLGSDNSKMGSANLISPSAKVLQIAERMDGISRSVPSSRGILKQKIKLKSLIEACKEWIKDPSNMALLLWITCVTVSGAVLFLVMTGMLNNSLPRKSQRDAWFEVNNQILNALFTLMCLYHHPKRFHHFILLCRWEPNDITILRKTYCKNGTYKPHEWTHMMIQLVLLHINCFAQYALCGLNLGYKKSERQTAGVAVCISTAMLAAAAAGLYSILSPLGKEYNHDDDENQNQILRHDTKESHNGMANLFRSRIVDKPQWRGGLFHFLGDRNTACLSIFCSFCLFGWNMERLGLGNIYVHIATFVIYCTAPLLLFGLAANIVDSEVFKVVFISTGILVSVFGLLYGGYWRIQMRKKFNLEKNNKCFGKPNVADCAQWLFCCCCSLAQEVRTADYYEIMEDKFCKKQRDGDVKIEILLPLPREGGKVKFGSNPGSQIWDNTRLSEIRTEKSPDPNKFLDDTDRVKQLMKPPDQSSMQRDGDV